MRPGLLLAAVLAVPSFASAAPAGPLPDLAGVPLDLRCTATLPPSHPALRRYPGRDAVDLSREMNAEDPSTWVGDALCAHLWAQLEEAGAHAAPRDVKLPARAVLTASLQRLWIEGSRIVEQRIGSTIMPVSIPHWAVATSWQMTFGVEYADARRTEPSSGLSFEMAGSAEQDDYAPLRLDALLHAASLDAFSPLPRLLADEGQLGDLLFALVESPDAPSLLGLEGEAADGFWQLLSTRADQRHDAVAFYLSADALPVTRRRDLARWFLLNDPDVSLRRDVLAWLVSQERPEGDFSDELTRMLAWLVLRERASRVRAEAVRVLGERGGESVRWLLVAASTDPDKRVSDRAMSGLRNEAPPTAAELETLPEPPTMPRVPEWTRALDGRVSPEEPPARSLARLALALGGPAAETWLARWAARGEVDGAWVVDVWRELAVRGSVRVRKQVLVRLAEEGARPGVPELIEERIRDEDEPSVRVAAIQAVSQVHRAGLDSLLIEVSRESNPSLRIAAVEVMAGVPGDRVQQRLERLAGDDPEGKVRRAARKALKARAKAAWKQG